MLSAEMVGMIDFQYGAPALSTEPLEPSDMSHNFTRLGLVEDCEPKPQAALMSIEKRLMVEHLSEWTPIRTNNSAIRNKKRAGRRIVLFVTASSRCYLATSQPNTLEPTGIRVHKERRKALNFFLTVRMDAMAASVRQLYAVCVLHENQIKWA